MVGTCGRYLPLQMCYPNLQRPVPHRNSDLWVTWPVGFLQINPQILVDDSDSCSPLAQAIELPMWTLVLERNSTTWLMVAWEPWQRSINLLWHFSLLQSKWHWWGGRCCTTTGHLISLLCNMLDKGGLIVSIYVLSHSILLYILSTKVLKSVF